MYAGYAPNSTPSNSGNSGNSGNTSKPSGGGGGWVGGRSGLDAAGNSAELSCPVITGNAIKAIEESLDCVPFASEMDVYRTKHPRIAQIKGIIAKKYPDDLEKQGKEFVAFTSFFADVLELTVISHMISEGYSVIKETTGKNSKGICGMIEALKSQYPQMTASIACMAVAQEVSIDGTLTRGATMNNLTAIFVEDLKKAGIETKPVGRGNVPRSFSEDTCSKIPDSMARIADSGLVDGEFLIVKRGKEDSVRFLTLQFQTQLQSKDLYHTNKEGK